MPPYGGYESAVHIHEIVIPRSEATWESVFPTWQEVRRRGVRIATPACAPVRNDKDFVGGAMHVGGGVRGANRAPPVAEEAR